MAAALRSVAMAAREDPGSKARRRVARTLVATYHEACFRGGSGAYAETVAATLERLTAEGERPDWWAAVGRRPRG